MHYKTVKDVVEHSSGLHQQISHLYHQISQAQTQERVKVLLNYLQTHETQLGQSLSQFANDDSQTVLNSWLQYAPDHDISGVLDTIDTDHDMSTDDVIEVALKLDDYFISLYETMVEKSACVSVKSVFENLLEMEQQEKIRIAKTALAINDV